MQMGKGDRKRDGEAVETGMTLCYLLFWLPVVGLGNEFRSEAVSSTKLLFKRGSFLHRMLMYRGFSCGGRNSGRRSWKEMMVYIFYCIVCVMLCYALYICPSSITTISKSTVRNHSRPHPFTILVAFSCPNSTPSPSFLSFFQYPS